MKNRDTTWYRRGELIVPILVVIIVAVLPKVLSINRFWMGMLWLILAVCIIGFVFILVSSKQLRTGILVIVIILLAVGGFFGVWEQWIKDRAAQNVGELTKILGDKNLSVEWKVFTLISYLHYKLIEPEYILSCGYRLEEKYGQLILNDLFKEYGSGDYTPTSDPIGYVDLPTGNPSIKNNERYYFIEGWAIDNSTNDFTYRVWLDDEPIDDIEINKCKRDDIKDRFKNYKNLPEKTGFKLKCKIPNNMINKDVKMRVRVTNKQSTTHFRDIFNSWVKITKTRIKVLSPKSE